MIWLLLATIASAVDAPAIEGARALVLQHRAHRAASHPPTMNEDAWDRVVQGKVATGLESVPGQSHRQAWGLAVLDAPVGQVWSAINDLSLRPDLSRVDFAVLVQGRPCESGRTIFQYLPMSFPLADRWWVSTLTETAAVSRASGGKVRELAFHARGDAALLSQDLRDRAEGGTPIGSSEGSWLAVAIDDSHTLVQYHALSDPGGYVPTSVANAFATGGVEENLLAVGRLAQAGPGCPAR